MTATCNLIGGLGNHFYQIAHLVAYAKKHSTDYYIPPSICAYNKPSFNINKQGNRPSQLIAYREPSDGKNPVYIDTPLINNIMFDGFWQTFKYFDWCRQDILDLFNFPCDIQKGIVSLHVRRGDAIGQEETFPMAPIEYYSDCISYMNKKGYNKFLVFSDDVSWCKEQFTENRFKDNLFQFSEGKTDLEDLISLSNCEHHIVARSTFSFSGAWLCQNPNKIVLCPPFPLFKNCHKDMVPDYYTVIDCEISTTQNWADEYKQNRKLNIKLPNVTLLSLCTKDVELGVEALKYSMRNMTFAKAKLISHYKPDNLPSNIEWEYVPKMATIDDWNHEVFYNLWKYFDTEFVLFIHPDGFVVNPQSWKDEFLQYDYIGSPWPMDCAIAIRGPRVATHELVRVGNSVGLRSRKLCKIPSDVGIPWFKYNGDYNEDTQIVAHNRKIFKENGCKFAPIELAVYFGREKEIPEGVHITHPFLFHKWEDKNKDYPKF